MPPAGPGKALAFLTRAGGGVVFAGEGSVVLLLSKMCGLHWAALICPELTVVLQECRKLAGSPN